MCLKSLTSCNRRYQSITINNLISCFYSRSAGKVKTRSHVVVTWVINQTTFFAVCYRPYRSTCVGNVNYDIQLFCNSYSNLYPQSRFRTQ